MRGLNRYGCTVSTCSYSSNNVGLASGNLRLVANDMAGRKVARRLKKTMTETPKFTGEATIHPDRYRKG